jgi:antitoxin component of RelBE/YafQ-DinJ toxin-antitoxin module|tara:strand:- start:194 stop:538 length:345 start_codon:yes stop_codon:yes gene_type:complete
MEGKYGESKKKIVFFDTEGRHVELKLRLEHYGLTQSKLFRYLVTCMIEENQISKDLIEMIDAGSTKKTHRRAKRVDVIEEKAKQKQDQIEEKLNLESEELEDIFDMIAREHPDL